MHDIIIGLQHTVTWVLGFPSLPPPLTRWWESVHRNSSVSVVNWSYIVKWNAEDAESPSSYMAGILNTCTCLCKILHNIIVSTPLYVAHHAGPVTDCTMPVTDCTTPVTDCATPATDCATAEMCKGSAPHKTAGKGCTVQAQKWPTFGIKKIVTMVMVHLGCSQLLPPRN